MFLLKDVLIKEFTNNLGGPDLDGVWSAKVIGEL